MGQQHLGELVGCASLGRRGGNLDALRGVAAHHVDHLGQHGSGHGGGVDVGRQHAHGTGHRFGGAPEAFDVDEGRRPGHHVGRLLAALAVDAPDVGDHGPSGDQFDRPRGHVAEPAGAGAEPVDVGVGAVGQEPSEDGADLGLDGGRTAGAVGNLDRSPVVPDRRGGAGFEGGVETLTVDGRLAGATGPRDELAVGPGQLEDDGPDRRGGIGCGGGWLGFGDAQESVEHPFESLLLTFEIGDGLAVVAGARSADRRQCVVGLVEQIEQCSTPGTGLGFQARGRVVVGLAPGVGLDEGQEGWVTGDDAFGPDLGSRPQALRRRVVVGAALGLVDDRRVARFVHWCVVCFLLGRGRLSRRSLPCAQDEPRFAAGVSPRVRMSFVRLAPRLPRTRSRAGGRLARGAGRVGVTASHALTDTQVRVLRAHRGTRTTYATVPGSGW